MLGHDLNISGYDDLHGNSNSYNPDVPDFNATHSGPTCYVCGQPARYQFVAKEKYKNLPSTVQNGLYICDGHSRSPLPVNKTLYALREVK